RRLRHGRGNPLRARPLRECTRSLTMRKHISRGKAIACILTLGSLLSACGTRVETPAAQAPTTQAESSPAAASLAPALSTAAIPGTAEASTTIPGAQAA